MIGNRITHRLVDGVRVPGTWRHAFIRNGGTHFLTDLFIYADGLIDCWGLVTVEEFSDKLRSGWVATDIPDGAEASAHELARWTFSEPSTWLTPDLLLAEVRDTIDELNGRPDSTERCLAAVDVFLADRKDVPLQVLVAGPGGSTWSWPVRPVTQEVYDSAVEYFEERARWIAEQPSRVPADGPVTSFAPAVHLYHSFPREPAPDPGPLGLRHDYPAPIAVGPVTYPSAARAYWALSVADPGVREAIRTAETVAEARALAVDGPRRDGWEHARTAVMADLLRAKFDRHPALAEILLATGDATIVYDDMESGFWGDNAGRGRNWAGRLLELVRSELHARRAGLLP
ncbi:NADAR family protein [Herbidospora galbida]|uniref:NADAR family protein n=1 Tax=Herbidospora galbida TaxID=2575442 RepID=A0A4U3MI23_9ACTN|nr:NADAR family protein [Herbidospora galbida]TKK88034.1 NADAR family protein [Herbidospora galbida]